VLVERLRRHFLPNNPSNRLASPDGDRSVVVHRPRCGVIIQQELERCRGTLHDPVDLPANEGMLCNRFWRRCRQRNHGPQRVRTFEVGEVLGELASDCCAECCEGCVDECCDAWPGVFEPEVHYKDGMNFYNYVGSNPPSGTDPHGLSILYAQMIFSAALSDEIYARKAGQDLTTGFALYRQVMYLTALAVGVDILIDLFPPHDDGRRDTCRCLCIKPDPVYPGQNQGPGPIGRIPRSLCANYPYTAAGRAGGYTYCWCK
jgi:hypothetical protein